MQHWAQICRIEPDRSTRLANGGWAYDAYPELEKLDAFQTITVADIKGPAVITCLHVTQHLLYTNTDKKEHEEQRLLESARGVLIEIYFNGHPMPAVRAPLADFFADGCGGRAQNFSSVYVEKAPKAYNCFIPMPFEKSARIVLINETENDYMSYSFAEYETLPRWDDSLGYFHATWSRRTFQLGAKTNEPFLDIQGAGHLLGRSWSVGSDEDFFNGFFFIMEGNNEFRIDGEAAPRLNYLGTEDSFAFSWGFQNQYTGPYAGMNYIKNDAMAGLSLASLYRFFGNNVVRFNKSVSLRVNWSSEAHIYKIPGFMEKIEALNKHNKAWVDYATTTYWYQSHIGHDHAQMPPHDERKKLLLHPNRV